MTLIFALLLLLSNATAQDFFMGSPPPQINNVPMEPMINEGSPDCAQFIYAPNSLSAKCLAHKLTIDNGRYDTFSISLGGLEPPDFSDTVDLTFGVNQCRNTFEVSCIQGDFCTVAYMNDGFKTTLKIKALRFVVSGDLITAEATKYDNQGTQNIYQCRTSINMITPEKLRYEVRIYLNRAFAGHNIEINGGDIRKYRNGDQPYTTTTTEQPAAPANFPPYGSRFPFPPFPIGQSTQTPDLATQPTPNIDNRPRNEENPFGTGMSKNSVVTVNGMQKSPDGKSILLDITVRTQVKVPNTFF